MTPAETKPQADFLAGAGEMAVLIRQFDWATTPLGAMESWPEPLTTSLSLILASPHPIWIAWGSEMTVLYNDACARVLGSKHPRALGRPSAEVWAEIWDISGPLANRVLTGGEASSIEEVRLFIDRGDFLEESFYSMSCSPVRNESGRVCGLFCPVTDVTTKMLNARRLKTLSELATNPFPDTLARNPHDVPFALLCRVDKEGRSVSVEQIAGRIAGVDPSLCGLDEVLRTGARKIVAIDHLFGFPPGVAGRPVSQAAVLPLAGGRDHKSNSVLVAGVNPCRPLDPDHLNFFDLLASVVASAIQNARDVEDENRQADVLGEPPEVLGREREAGEEAEMLKDAAHQLPGQLDLEKLVEIATDAATKLTGAEFGAFFRKVLHNGGESYALLTVSGVPRAAFENYPLPSNAFRGAGVVRSDGMIEDLPPGNLRVGSYLAVPAISRSGEVLGGFFLGHSNTGVFTARSERLAAGIAGQAAMAIDNSRLFAKAEQEIARRNEVEKALREGEKRFREMIDALPAAIYTTDADGRLIHFNPAAVRLSGRVPELGTDQWCVTWKLFLPDGTALPHDRCPMAIAVKEGRVVSGGEYIAERPDGSRFWFTPYPTPLRDSEGRIVGGINMLVDITGRKTAEEALRRSEERFRGVFESSAIGVAILNLDAHFLQANNAFCAITGYSEQELRALDYGALTHPDDGAAMHERIRQLVSGETPTFVLEQRCFTKNGRTIWVQNSVSAMRDAEGRPEHLLALCEEVTVRKQAETAIRESEERFRAIVDTTPECVKVVAADGTLLMMNSSGLQMVDAPAPEAAVGNSVYDLIAPEFRDEYRKFNQRICNGEKGALEFDIIGLRGRRRHMQTYAAPFRNSDGSLAQLAITHDITERKHAERADLLLAAIIESSDDAIVSKDLNGIITSWNKGAERLFGYTAEEVVGKSITIIIPPDRLGEEPQILSRLRRGERVDHFETIRRRKDGTLLNISLTISPVKDARGKVIGASKIARDITDRKRSEAAIQKLNEQLTTELVAMTRLQALSTRLVQADDFPVLLGEILDAAMEITRAEKGNVQLFDDDMLKTVCQRGFEAPFLEFFDSVHAGNDACGAALDRGERVIVEDVAASELFSGTALDRMLLAGVRAVESTPLVSRAGQVLGVLSTHYGSPHRPGERDLRMLDLLARQAADLIERKRAEAALLASEARFRQLADSMPQMVWTARPDGYVDYFNERWYEFTGFARDTFGDTGWEPVVHPDDIKRCHEAWYASVRTGEPYRIEYRFWDRAESRWRWFMGRALPIRNQRGEMVKWFGSCTDIDEQKRVEDELRRANYDLEQFAYSASHDLQEPLRGVKIYSELLNKRHADQLDGEALQFLSYLRGSATRMEMLVRDLLAYTQVGRLEPPDRDSDANHALEEALANLQGAIVESGARVTSDPLPPVRVHDTHLKQLFQNLIGNAIKYRSRERIPLIHVSAERRDGNWRFSVSDNGIGIEPQYKERIFGLFKRLHTGDEYSGTGIGLAICQRIVDRYHGRIWVESEPGRGSRFLFTLPV